MTTADSPADLERRFWDGNSTALRCVQAALATAQEIRIASGYFEASGFRILSEVLQGKRIYLLVGREEGGEDNVRQVLQEFREELSCAPQEKLTRTMMELLSALEQRWLSVVVGADLPDERRSWLDARYRYHHAKIYIADERAAVVGSPNMSRQGLCRSHEAGSAVTRPDDVAYFVRRFDLYFKEARSITAELIDALQQWLKAYDPYTIYARTLLELFDLPREETPPQLPRLAKYQEGITSSVLNALLTHDCAFLVASTGLGKTVVAGHLAAYLRMQGEIDNAIVIGPAGLREVWRRMLRAARVVSVEFSYHTLQQGDRKGDSSLPILEHELRQATESTLIILDEVHRLRNEKSSEGDLRRSNQRIQEVVREKGAKVLLLTGTPYSREISDVNSQLGLLPAPKNPLPTPLGMATPADSWHVEELADLADLPPCTVLSTPDVVRHFAQLDEAGEHYVAFGQGERRYFPRRVRLQTVRYVNPLDDFLAALLESGLLNKKREGPGTSVQLALPMVPLEGLGVRNPLQEAHFLHEFCSSTAQAKYVCDKLEKGGYDYTFARQEELSAFIRRRRRAIRHFFRPGQDPKMKRLAELLGGIGEKKAVIFCEYLDTARSLANELPGLLPGMRVETTANYDDLDDLLRRFAPVANEVLEEERDPELEIQVLAVTRKMSEGFNLQDAPIVVNYDLPWTVLQLAQRMGRILRPWPEPRDVVIYNFVPSTMGHEGVRHARNWEQRLEERSRQLRSLAQIPVLVHRESQGLEEEFVMEKLGRELFLANDDTSEMDLDQVLEFTRMMGDLTTSSFYHDLAVIANRAELLSMPLGIRSAVPRSGPKRLFLLLRGGRSRVYPVLADRQGRCLPQSQHLEELMSLIRCVPGVERAPLDAYPEPDEFDAWIERTREDWARCIELDDPTRLQIVCAMALVPGKGR